MLVKKVNKAKKWENNVMKQIIFLFCLNVVPRSTMNTNGETEN